MNRMASSENPSGQSSQYGTWSSSGGFSPTHSEDYPAEEYINGGLAIGGHSTGGYNTGRYSFMGYESGRYNSVGHSAGGYSNGIDISLDSKWPLQAAAPNPVVPSHMQGYSAGNKLGNGSSAATVVHRKYLLGAAYIQEPGFY